MPWQGKLFRTWVCQFFPGRVWTTTRWALAGEMVYKMSLSQFFPGRVWTNTMGLGRGMCL